MRREILATVQPSSEPKQAECVRKQVGCLSRLTWQRWVCFSPAWVLLALPAGLQRTAAGMMHYKWLAATAILSSVYTIR